MYISGNVTTLEILLESGDMSAFLTRAEMVKSVSEHG
jgi:peptidoglycan hydrolase CwlO-like protein